jgi:hypothetical protein
MPVGYGIAFILLMIVAAGAIYFAGRYYIAYAYYRVEVAKALEPFATFANDNTDCEGWNDAGLSTKDERVVDWFGPSDFNRAATVYRKTLEAGIE